MVRMREADIVLASPRTLRLSFVALLYRIFLRSRYIHSMLYLGRGKVLHTTFRRGVVVDRLPLGIFRGHRYAVYRARGLSREQREAIVGRARTRLEEPLDPVALVTNIPSRWFGLDRPFLRLHQHHLWCSRLIEIAYRESDVALVPDEQADCLTSEDLRQSPRLVRIHPPTDPHRRSGRTEARPGARR